MKIQDPGAHAVWPKLLTCRNCGCEVEVKDFADMARGFPFFMVLPGVPGGFQFACPNLCGAAYVAQCPAFRQQFHHASHVHYGGDDVTAIRTGTRRPQPVRRRMRRNLRRRLGGSDGSVQAAR